MQNPRNFKLRQQKTSQTIKEPVELSEQEFEKDQDMTEKSVQDNAKLIVKDQQPKLKQKLLRITKKVAAIRIGKKLIKKSKIVEKKGKNISSTIKKAKSKNTEEKDQNSKLASEEETFDEVECSEEVKFGEIESTILLRTIEDFDGYGLNLEVQYKMKVFIALIGVLMKCRNPQNIKGLMIILTHDEYGDEDEEEQDDDENESTKLKLLTQICQSLPNLKHLRLDQMPEPFNTDELMQWIQKQNLGIKRLTITLAHAPAELDLSNFKNLTEFFYQCHETYNGGFSSLKTELTLQTAKKMKVVQIGASYNMRNPQTVRDGVMRYQNVNTSLLQLGDFDLKVENKKTKKLREEVVAENVPQNLKFDSDLGIRNYKLVSLEKVKGFGATHRVKYFDSTIGQKLEIHLKDHFYWGR